jgi:hypothetical protein
MKLISNIGKLLECVIFSLVNNYLIVISRSAHNPKAAGSNPAPATIQGRSDLDLTGLAVFIPFSNRAPDKRGGRREVKTARNTPEASPRYQSRTERQAWLLFLLWILLCLPLLLLGFGSDYDAWRVAQTADTLWRTGVYTPSRSLGFPLYELLVTPLIASGGWLAGNALSLLAGALIFLALHRLARRGHFQQPLQVIATLLFLPIFYKNATVTMDYLPALATLLWAYLCLQESRFDCAALLVGLSTGLRPTAILFMLPMLWFIRQTTHDWRRLFRALTLSLLAALLAYSPVLLAEGFGMPTPAPRSSLLQHFGLVVFHALRFFGVAQTLLLIPLLLFGGRRQRVAGLPAGFGSFHLLNLGVWLALFLLLPDEPEYLLPALPSLLFLMDRLLSPKTFTAAMILFFSYHLLQIEVRPDLTESLRMQPRLAAGYTIEDIRDRIFKLSSRRVATRFHPQEPILLMFGLPWIPAVNEAWYWDEELGAYRQRDGEFYLAGRITDRDRIEQFKRRGIRLVAWRLAVWDYLRTGSTAWQDDVEVLEDVRMLFPEPIRGKPLNER